MPVSPLASAAIAALNHLLEPAPWARERLMAYAGSVVSLQAGTIVIMFTITETGRASGAADAPAPAVTIMVPLQSLPAMLSSGNKALPADVRIEGSAELADAVGFVLRNLRWEAEEDLSRVIGDIPARRVAMAVQSLRSTGARAIEALTGNMAERLGEDDAPVLARPAHDGFAVEVGALRDAVERLEKRVKRQVHPRRS